MSTPPPAAVATAAHGTWIDDWIRIDSDGRLTVHTGKVELGTGVVAAMAQIAAEELDVAHDAVDVARVATPLAPDEGYTAGSKSIRLSSS
jgi:CO/xanthine dehydrogenase Mo-binding subunit